VVGSPVVKDVVGDLEEYSENVEYLKLSTTSSSMIPTMNNVGQSTNFNKTQHFDIGDPMVLL